ncbi:DUF551 domain-containing protein [Hymenobacter fodinae]|nr:DUF551 domain-containing protein [Hymenobacter fodinae]
MLGRHDVATPLRALAQQPTTVAPEVEKWVSVEDRLPEILPDKVTYGSAPDEDDYDEEDALNVRRSEEVLVYARPFSNSSEFKVLVAVCKGYGTNWELLEDGWCLWEVTHWQPLPQAPTVGKKGGVEGE